MTSTPATLEALAERLRSREGALHEYLAWLERRFEAAEPDLQSFMPEADRFGRLQEEAEQQLHRYPDPSRRPALFGLPLGVKDIFHVDGFETRAGSSLPPEVLAGEQAESVRILRDAGALILGKTVTTEFAYFAPGPTRNPHSPGHTPGGSSSGSAAAVAAGLAPLALGTQTIGSINRPASFCGVVGYKPSYGRISALGVIPLSPTLDHVGFFTPDAGSAAWVAPRLVQTWKPTTDDGRPLRLGIPGGPYLEKAGAEAMERFTADGEVLRSSGHALIQLSSMDDFEAIVDRHNLILAAEAAKVHRDWFGSFSEKYHPKTSALIRRGKTIPIEALEQARREQGLLQERIESLMDEHKIDAWITPSAPGPAPEGLASTGDPVMNLPWTQCGMPSVTLPSGITTSGLPLALQLIARRGQDERLLLWASQIEPLLVYETIHGLYEFLEA